MEHGAYADEAALAAMAQQGTVWVPTLSTVGNLRGKGRFCEAAVNKILESTMENVGRYTAMGGLIACGSDAGAWAVPHGCESEDGWLARALGADTAGVLKKGNQKIQEKF